MDNTKDFFGYESLAFFGKVNASISHELKNVLAIISETAGLMGDLSNMASMGKPIEPDMLKSCTSSIVEEIQRGFATIRQMNRFAHSVDVPIQSVNLLEMLDLVINLSGYLSYCGKTSLLPCEYAAPISMTCPFILQAVVYETLVHSHQCIAPDMEINISVQRRDDTAWRIIFPGLDDSEPQTFPNAGTKAMATSIGVVIHCDSSVSSLELDVPLTIENLTAQDLLKMQDRSYTSQTPL